ncbi:hypothetical protein Trco_007333 [Trichoderma cornu-damae]|uniref:Uncharacterized protein n=1 Tax=Trichoderma cornu-damae TaxID=654480 RepID=A0A9P8QJV6_9HYPO|nr:hypothetical protein Trco_007333 [Trichoderma cornu-damae]
MSNPDPPRRRFVPVPIETTFQSYRKNVYDYASHHRMGPNPELTPEPSPRSPPPQFPLEVRDNEESESSSSSRERRRFAPQLIETSRRSRRVGDPGPATRPADKTDITPYTNHIYSAKSKLNRRQHGHAGGEDELQRPFPPTRRETEEEGVQEYLLELAAKEVARQIEEAALAAFPNSRPREGGVAHFYFRDSSSDSENSPEASPPDEEAGQHRLRRKSSNLGLNWWHKHMQEHASRLEQERGDDEMDVDDEEAAATAAVEDDEAEEQVVEEMEEVEADAGPGPAAAAAAAAADSPIIRSDSDLDKMELPSPPDLMWTTTKPLSPTDDRRESVAELQMALAEANRHAAQAQANLVGSPAQAAPPAQAQGAPGEPHTPVSHHLPGRQEPGPFGRPFAGFRLPPDHDPKLLKLRQGPSPPMLGKDLVFRRCPSPKFTTLEPEDPLEAHMIEDQGRDLPGQAGLWRGYCCRSESTGGCAAAPDLHIPRMIETPSAPSSPDKCCTCDVVDAGVLSEEPVSIFSSSGTASSGLTSSTSGLWGSSPQQQQQQHQHQHQQHQNGAGEPEGGPHGANGLVGLNERLQREKVQAERDEKILQEFGEDFVTQVYNYLSLGYPAMARGFDEELSRISHIGLDELRRDDEKQMAKGHMVEMKLDASAPEEERCPRWVALRVYITEWARQHPDLDNLDPLAWGVRERRGSWAI